MLRIKRIRQAKGLSLADVAKQADLHREAVARAEREGVDLRASTVERIAKALGVPVCELFEQGGHERRDVPVTRRDSRARVLRSQDGAKSHAKKGSR